MHVVHPVEIIIGLLLIVSLLAVLAEKIRIAYPIFLVIAGLGIGFIPGVPKITLDPDLVLLFFLPPLLYVAALNTSWRDFRRNIQPISLLAIGLVLFSTTAVAVFAKHYIEGMSWAAAFVLGAIISPPDAVAATAICKRMNVPRRVVTVLEGESLVNDATGLTAYRFAVAAVVSGVFSLFDASMQFIFVAVGGILVGYFFGWSLAYIRKKLDINPTIGTIMSLLTPFTSYIPAELLGVSGVLSVVTTGLYLTRRSSLILSSATRLQTVAVWQTVVFLMNGVIFILIGLQFPHIIESLTAHDIYVLLAYAAAISIVTIVVRIVWVFALAYIRRWISKKTRENDPMPPKSHLFILGWTGMRGIVSLAAALALPVTIQDGSPFPHRDIIIFITFAVIFATLVLQGLSMPLLIKLLRIKGSDEEIKEEMEARVKMTAAALKHLESLIKKRPELKESPRISHLRNEYNERLNHYSFLSDTREETECLLQHNDFMNIHKSLLKVEKDELIKLRDKEIINDEILRKIQLDIDLEEAQIKKT